VGAEGRVGVVTAFAASEFPISSVVISSLVMRGLVVLRFVMFDYLGFPLQRIPANQIPAAAGFRFPEKCGAKAKGVAFGHALIACTELSSFLRRRS
jgi:hypothetical protein